MITAIRKISSGIKEIPLAGALLRLTSMSQTNNALEANFLRFGASFGADDIIAFADAAIQFYEEGMKSKDPLYTIVDMGDDRIAIDYNGEVRGIYTSKGKPLAFFRPDFKKQGYATKEMELEFFKNKNSLDANRDALYITE